MDTDGDGLARRLLLDDALDVDDIFETVDGDDLALAALVGASDNGNLIVLSDGDGADLKSLLDLGAALNQGEYERCISHGAPC